MRCAPASIPSTSASHSARVCRRVKARMTAGTRPESRAGTDSGTRRGAHRAEARARHLREERIERGALLVVAQRHDAHQVRVGKLEPVVILECLAEAQYAAFAADAGDLQSLR